MRPGPLRSLRHGSRLVRAVQDETGTAAWSDRSEEEPRRPVELLPGEFRREVEDHPELLTLVEVVMEQLEPRAEQLDLVVAHLIRSILMVYWTMVFEEMGVKCEASCILREINEYPGDSFAAPAIMRRLNISVTKSNIHSGESKAILRRKRPLQRGSFGDGEDNEYVPR